MQLHRITEAQSEVIACYVELNGRYLVKDSSLAVDRRNNIILIRGRVRLNPKSLVRIIYTLYISSEIELRN